MKKKLLLIAIVCAVAIGIVATISLRPKPGLKIGVITPLTGNSAYWGESTLIGIKMAKSRLREEGVPVTFVVEDGQLEPKPALNAAQKLVNIDNVQAIYSEFNPASIAVSSFLKGKNVFHFYDSAAVSPLENGSNNFKTYLDYETSCKKTAAYIKESRGIKKVGVLKMNIEFGELCLRGITSVFDDKVAVEDYDPTTTDFRVPLSKLRVAGVDAIFQATFQPQTQTTIREMHELGIKLLFVGLSETMTPDVRNELGPLIQGGIFFGLPQVNKDLLAKIKTANDGKDVGNENAAALAYVHLVQLATALAQCNGDTTCTGNKITIAPPVPEIGFEGFNNRKAVFSTEINELRNGELVKVN